MKLHKLKHRSSFIVVVMNIIKEWPIQLIVLSYLLGITTGLLIAEIITKLLD